MPQSSWRPGEKSSPAKTRAPKPSDTTSAAAVVGEALGFENISNNNNSSISGSWEERMERKQPQEQNGGEAGRTVVALKVVVCCGCPFVVFQALFAKHVALSAHTWYEVLTAVGCIPSRIILLSLLLYAATAVFGALVPRCDFQTEKRTFTALALYVPSVPLLR